MAKSKDILVGLTIKANETPEKITESFDGENESVSYDKLVDAFKDLKDDLKDIYKDLSDETDDIKIKKKSFE